MAPKRGACELTTDEMNGEVLARARAKRGGNRTVLTKVANKAQNLLKEEILNRREKLELVKSLDETIIEKCKVEDIEHEIEESHEINERVIEIRRRIMDALAEMSSDKSDNKGISTETNAVADPGGGSGGSRPTPPPPNRPDVCFKLKILHGQD